MIDDAGDRHRLGIMGREQHARERDISHIAAHGIGARVQLDGRPGQAEFWGIGYTHGTGP